MSSMTIVPSSTAASLISKADCMRLFALFDEYEELVKGRSNSGENTAFIKRMKSVLKGQFKEKKVSMHASTGNQQQPGTSATRGTKRPFDANQYDRNHSYTCEDFVEIFKGVNAEDDQKAVWTIYDIEEFRNMKKDPFVEWYNRFRRPTSEEIQEACLAVVNDDDSWDDIDEDLDGKHPLQELDITEDSSPAKRPRCSTPLEVSNKPPKITTTLIEPASPTISETTAVFDIIDDSVFETVADLINRVEQDVVLEEAVDDDTIECSWYSVRDVSVQADYLERTFIGVDKDKIFDSLSDSEFPEDFPFTEGQKKSREQTRPKREKKKRDAKEQERRERARIKALFRGEQVGHGDVAENVAFEAIPINIDMYSSDYLNRDVITTVYNISHNLGSVDLFQMEAEIDNLFAALINDKVEQYNANDIICVTIKHESLSSEIFVYAKKRNFNTEDILSAIMEVSQSNRTFLVNGVLTIEVAITKEKFGSGARKLPQTVSQKRKRKTGLIELKNNDNSCGYMAIALAIFYHEHRNDRTYHERDAMKKNSGGRLKRLATDLFSELSVNVDAPMRMSDVKVISDYLATKKIQLIVVNGHTATKDFDSNVLQDTRIYIELYNEHFNVITKIASYFDRDYFCYFCWTGYYDLGGHRCNMCCRKCQECNQCIGKETKCRDCNRVFNGRKCFANHKKTLCAQRKCCDKCNNEYFVRKDRPHKCLEYICKLCGETFVNSPHYCMMSSKQLAKLKEEDKEVQFFVAFDIESRLDKHQYVSHYSKHTAILLKCETVCSDCYSTTENAKTVASCNMCGVGKQSFTGENCAQEFCDYLYNDLSKRATANGRVFVFSHNFRGYDGHFILRDAFKRDFAQITPTMKGSKILKLDIGNIRFIDTLSFFQTPLAALPKMFGFENRVVKGYFPYTFNTIENANYIGEIPAKEHFNVKRMKAEELAKFNLWYEQRKLHEYSLQQEMEKYCENDVDIVLISLMTFRKIMYDLTGINPLTRCFTIASIVFEAQRALFLKDKKVGVTPICGYKMKRNSSRANTWISLYELYEHKTVAREYRVGKYYADGCVVEEKRILEFFGCMYHGCPKCYTSYRDRPSFLDKSPNQLYSELQEKLNYYIDMGFKIHFEWECDFVKFCNTCDKNVKEDIDELYYNYKIKAEYGGCDIRGEAFMGGRTNNFRFYYTAKEGEKIRLLDIRSSYPSVMKKRKYWAGHPVSVFHDFDYSLNSYNGFVKAVVVPPKKLYLPPLSVKINNKLVFPLCRTCTELQQQSSCEHEEHERWLIWTWTTDTLKLALTLGYNIIRIIHVLHYEEEIDDLFTGQMNLFGKAKIESSGYPSHIVTEEQKNEYIENIRNNEGIELEAAAIEYNPSKRTTSKVSLNANFGKMGQNANMPQTIICRDYCTLWNILNNNEYKVIGTQQVTPDVVMVCYKMADISKCSPGNTSVAIAAKITDAGREELWKAMNTVVSNGPDRLLYCDTDSVMYIEREGDTKLEIGPYFGDLTDEIVDTYGQDAVITRMVACGPKNYGYEVSVNGTTKAVIKLKGIQQDSSTLSLVNMETMLSMVDKYAKGVREEVKLSQFRIQVDKKTHEVNSFNFEKMYRCMSEKRRICGDRNGTVPYGWVGECPY